MPVAFLGTGSGIFVSISETARIKAAWDVVVCAFLDAIELLGIF
jgi:hypothetical protein